MSRAHLDLTGHIFDHLTVVCRGPSPVPKKRHWLCRCKCGSDKLVSVTTELLRRKTVISCGCVSKMEDLTGRQFNYLTVVGRAPTRNVHEGRRWLCQCMCSPSTIVDLPGKSLKSGSTKSCGCIRRGQSVKNIIGQRVGKLTILYRAPYDLKKPFGARWYAQCDCDPERKRLKIMSTHAFTSGTICSCGCAVRNGETVRSADVRAKRHAYWMEKYDTDPRFVLNVRFKALLRSSLKRKKATKRPRATFKSLEYSLDDLETHLKKTLPPGYTWDDFKKGFLHIDHVKPISTFHYQTYDDLEFKQGWALSNLQLLTAEHNMEKRARLNWKAPL